MKKSSSKSQSFLDFLFSFVPLLAVELVLLTAMNFATQQLTYRLLAIVILAFCILPVVDALQRAQKNMGFIFLLLQSLCLILYMGLSIFFGVNKNSNFTIVIAIILGSYAFYGIGLYYGLFENRLKIKNIIAMTYLGIGLYTLICLIRTIYGMGTPFYVLILANISVYLKYQARLITFGIFGTQLFDYGVSILANFAFISASGLFTLFFIDHKKSPFYFYSVLFGGICGLATIILIPMPFALMVFIILMIGFLLFKLKINNKHLRLSLLIGFGVLSLILMILYAVFRLDFHNNPTRYTEVLSPAAIALLTPRIGIINGFGNIKTLFANTQLIGSKFTSTVVSSGSVFLDILGQDGILAFVFLCVFIGVTIYQLIIFWLRCSQRDLKAGITALVISYLVTISVNYVGSNITDDFVFLPIVLLVGYISMHNLDIQKTQVNKEMQDKNLDLE